MSNANLSQFGWGWQTGLGVPAPAPLIGQEFSTESLSTVVNSQILNTIDGQSQVGNYVQGDVTTSGQFGLVASASSLENPMRSVLRNSSRDEFIFASGAEVGDIVGGAVATPGVSWFPGLRVLQSGRDNSANNAVFVAQAGSTDDVLNLAGLTDEVANGQATLRAVGYQGSDIETTLTGLRSTGVDLTRIFLPGRVAKLSGFFAGLYNTWVMPRTVTPTDVTFYNVPTGWAADAAKVGSDITVSTGSRWTPGNEKEYASVQVTHGPKSAGQAIVLEDLLVSGLSMSLTPGQVIDVTAQANWSCLDATALVQAARAVVNATKKPPMRAGKNLGRIVVGGEVIPREAPIQSATVNLTRGTSPIPGIGSDGPVDNDDGDTELRIDIQQRFNGYERYREGLEFQNSNIMLPIAMGGEAYVVFAPRARVLSPDLGIGGRNTQLQDSYTLGAQMDVELGAAFTITRMYDFV